MSVDEVRKHAQFQSTLPVGGATVPKLDTPFKTAISIHAPRGGSDRSSTPRYRCSVISIHAPRGGSDNRSGADQDAALHFNPRSPWGERPPFVKWWGRPESFQSTLPVGGATPPAAHQPGRQEISIHAPRGGSDSDFFRCRVASHYFNPRSPWGERLFRQHRHLSMVRNFNPRSPWGERLINEETRRNDYSISIHAPRGGSDSKGAQIYLFTFGENKQNPRRIILKRTAAIHNTR